MKKGVIGGGVAVCLMAVMVRAELHVPNVILGRPTDVTVAVNVLADTNLVAYLEYGTQSAVYASQTPATNHVAGNPLELELTGLQSDTRYFYRLNFKQVDEAVYQASPERAFHTRRAPGSSFTFCIQGDSHPERVNTQFDAGHYSNTLLTAAADGPDFYMTIGDDFSVDQIPTNLISAALVTERYTLQRPYLGLIGASSPLFLVNGNHEQAAAYLLDGTSNNIAVWAQTARNRYYPEPAPDGFYTGNTNVVPFIGLLRNYYAWTWGDALFVTLDPYWSSPTCVDNNYWTGVKRTNLWDATHGDIQYQWLKKTLEESTAKYKFVFAHHVLGTGRGGIEEAGLYEWGGLNGNGTWGFTSNRPAWALPIHQLMATNHVTLFVQGHDHLFARQQLDGVTYLELPEPADPTYTFWNSDAYTNSLYKTNNTGYVRVTVSAEQVKVDYVRTFLPAEEGAGKTNGLVDYSFTLPVPATGGGGSPLISSVSVIPVAPVVGDSIWVTARVTDDVGVASVVLDYNNGAITSTTNTVFLETMAASPTNRWTGGNCDNAWTVNYAGSNPFGQRGPANYGGGNTNGLEFKGGTTNLADSQITTVQGIDARGGSGVVSFAVAASGLAGDTGWALQLDSGAGFTTRVSELSGSNHTWQVHRYPLLPGDAVSNLVLRFQFQGGSTNNRIELDEISVALISGASAWTNRVMLDDGLHGDGEVGDGVYGAMIPPQAAGTTVKYFIAASNTAGSGATSPAAGAGSPYSFTVDSAAQPPYDVLLGRPTDSTIAISVLPVTNMQLHCLYGPQPGLYPNQTLATNLVAGVPGVLTLESLLPDTTYYYRLVYLVERASQVATGAEHSFHTQRAAATAFTFDIEADPHWRDPNASIDPSLWRIALANILADQPDFLIDLGDTFLTEKLGIADYAGASQLCREVRSNQFSMIGHTVPLFLVNGNHEAELGWLISPTQPQSNIAVWATQARETYYPCPSPGGFYSGNTNIDERVQEPRGDHYAFKWGNTLFVVLDPFWNTAPKPGASTCWNWTLGVNQYQWLQQTLEQTAATFKFVFIHHLAGGGFDGVARGGVEFSPYFEWGGHNADGTWGFTDNRPGWPMPIQALLLSNKVNAVFHGHDHLFVKQDLDANSDGAPELIYQECPQPSATNYNTTATATGYGYTNGVLQGNSGHLRVRVAQSVATIEYVRAYLPGDEAPGRTNRMVSYTYAITNSTDTVGDGIPDWWRMLYFGGSGTSTNAESCAAADPDHDGMDNRQEYLADLTPLNGNSRLAILALSLVTNGVQLTWIGGSNAWQYLECAPSLTTNQWVPVYTNSPPTSITNRLTDAGLTPATNRFYRLKASR